MGRRLGYIFEIKAMYLPNYMGTKEKKCLSSSTAVLDLDPMLPRFALPALGADPFQFKSWIGLK
jgi:hypothetical protein